MPLSTIHLQPRKKTPGRRNFSAPNEVLRGITPSERLAQSDRSWGALNNDSTRFARYNCPRVINALYG
jgi:hypothetical protein